TSAGAKDAFLRKYDASGALIWTRQFGTSGVDYVYNIAANSSGIFVVGYTDGTFAGETAAGGGDAFIRMYDTNGNVLWTRQYGSSAYDAAFNAVADANGVYIGGETIGTLPGQSSAGYIDGWFRRYDNSGNAGVTRQFGSAGHDSVFGMAISG